MYQLLSINLTRLALLVSLFYFGSSQAQVCRVSTSGTSNASGSSWQQTKSLISALNNSVNCPEIWVKSGVYFPTSGNDRSQFFSVKPGVELYGGFYGNETTRDQRDFVYNKAILSGDIGTLVSANDNSYHVIYLDATQGLIDQSTRIDGFIIKDGYADGVSSFGQGGGFYCDADGSETCSPYLKNLEFRNNAAKNGGAIYNYCNDGGDCRAVLEEVSFINNKALFGGSGGAIYNYSYSGTSSPVIHNAEFINNSAENHGGAMFNSSSESGSKSNPVISSSTFSANIAQNGGAMSSISYNNAESKPNIRSSTFHNNMAQEKGGAIYSEHADINLENVTIAENSALISGGGIYSAYSTSQNYNIINSILWANQAPSGAQLFNQGSYVSVDYSVIQNNCSGFGTDGSGSETCNNILTSDPLLGSLRNNQGVTQTMLPSIGSSAIDNGDNISCDTEDQRGISRPQNGQCDIGSVEILSACRVTINGSNMANGSDWSGQAMALQTALNTPTCHQVWIKTGTYKPTSSNDRSLSFNIPPQITVLGGFAGTEINPNDRNIADNPVILSGEIGNTNLETDNSYHVVKLDGTLGTKILASTIIADLEIHDGYASSGFFDFPNNSGAGLFCDGTGLGSACNPYLSNIRFINNQATGGSGGGMFNDANSDGESSPQLVNVTFDNNTAINGGAMYNAGSIGGSSNAIVINGQFLNNSADNSGGAVYNNANGGYNRSQFIFGQFFNNDANYGGAVYNSGQSFGINTASFNQVTFTSNQVSFDGGAFYSAGFNDGMSKPTIQDVTFASNLAGRGGAMFLNDLAGNGTAELNRVTFNQNLATNGGALYNDGENGFSHPKLTNVTFQSNLAVSNGGAIFNNGDNGASSPDITNVTFSGNGANYGGAMYSSADPSGTSSPIMRHVIMWGNTASTDGDTIYHNLAESNLFDSILEFGCPTNGVGNANCNNVMSNDPMLGTLSNNGGFTKTMLPAAGSPAIDAGDNNYCPGEDQRGQSRPNGSACDIGSVEVIGQGSTDIIFKNGFD